MTGPRAKQICPDCGRLTAVTANGSLQKHSYKQRPKPKSMTANLNRKLVIDVYQTAPMDKKPTLKQLGNMVGVTRERARQYLFSADITLRDPKRQAKEVRLAKFALDRLLQACEAATLKPPCPICGAYVIRLCNTTCSTPCAKRYATSARFVVNPEAHQKHRISVARTILRGGAVYTDVQIEWALKMLSDTPPPANRRWTTSVNSDLPIRTGVNDQ